MSDDGVALLVGFILLACVAWQGFRIKKLESAFLDVLWLAENADHRNGNTHPDNPGGIDEGEVKAHEMISRAKKNAMVKVPWDHYDAKWEDAGGRDDDVSF